MLSKTKGEAPKLCCLSVTVSLPWAVSGWLHHQPCFQQGTHKHKLEHCTGRGHEQELCLTQTSATSAHNKKKQWHMPCCHLQLALESLALSAKEFRSHQQAPRQKGGPRNDHSSKYAVVTTKGKKMILQAPLYNREQGSSSNLQDRQIPQAGSYSDCPCLLVNM